MAVGMAVITGALVTGDSVRAGLLRLVGLRLGNTAWVIDAGDRYVTDPLAERLQEVLKVPAAALLQLEGSAAAGGGEKRVPRVEIYGVDQNFRQVLGPGSFQMPISGDSAVISDNLAARLDLKTGDEILLRINAPGPVPMDAPFVSDNDNIRSVRLTVAAIAGKEQTGRFSLQNTQSAPFNVFVSKSLLQQTAELPGLSNRILLASGSKADREEILKTLGNLRTLEDASLHLEKHPGTGEWILTTPRVFFDDRTINALGRIRQSGERYFTYFVNEFRAGSQTTPYSFVSTLPATQIPKGEILINRWLAEDLNAKPGDSLTMSYFLVEPLRKLTVGQAFFRIREIISMEDPRCDRELMPRIPGLSDAGNCRDWETSIPIDLTKIRDKDEEYWNRFKGTPKAFINPEEASALWKNRFGEFTQIRFPATIPPDELSATILGELSPLQSGISLAEPATNGREAATGGIDFSGLFLGLSFFLIASGLILTILLIRLGLESRASQIGTLRGFGWPRKKITRMLLAETALVAIPGAVTGLALTYGYTFLIFKALNGVWNTIVLTDTLRPVFKPSTLAAGFVISIVLSVVSGMVSLRSFYRKKPSDLQRSLHRRKKGVPTFVMAIVSGLISLAVLVYGLTRLQQSGPVLFFIAGTFMLIAVLAAAMRLYGSRSGINSGNITTGRLAVLNGRRNRGRSLTVIILFAMGMFMVIAVGGNRKTTEGTGASGQGGTGGYEFFMETTVPVPDNLNDPAVRAKYGLETESFFVQLKKVAGDDASCLNLNRVTQPPLLGVPAGSLDGRFSFAALAKGIDKDHPWQGLEQVSPDGCIHAYADLTVIQWGLMLKIGDTLSYATETGDTIHLVLAGGLANSVFQGNLLISAEQITRYWPSNSGTPVFLCDCASGNMESVQNELLRTFRDYGADLVTAAEKLAAFNSVENTYLSIFLVMGALAMLLGTVGLGVILARNLQERKTEIYLLRACGISRRRITGMLVKEYLLLLAAGLFAGGFPAIISILPNLLNPASGVSAWFLLMIMGLLLLNGILWIWLLSGLALSKSITEMAPES